MKRTLIVLALAAAVTLVLAACGSNQAALAPTDPSLVPDPNSLQAQSTGLWTLTEVGVSASGTSRCFNSPPQVPPTFTIPMTVARTTSGVGFELGDPKYFEPIDFDSYSGTISGDSFVATGTNSSFCGGVQQPITETVTGTFSSDGRHLSAQELDVYHLPDGDVTYTLNWTADHQ